MLWPELADAAEWGFLALRVVIGIIFIAHGLPKITQSQQMAEMMPWGAGLVMVHGAVEVVGGVLLALGLITQIVAIVFGVIMIGAIFVKGTQMKTGFAPMGAAGWEWDLVLLAGLLLLFLAGPGDLAIDASELTIQG